MESSAERVYIKMSTKAINWRRRGAFSAFPHVIFHTRVTNRDPLCEKCTGTKKKMHTAESSIHFLLFCFVCKKLPTFISAANVLPAHVFDYATCKTKYMPDFHERLW